MRASHEVAFVMTVWQIEGMVRDDHLHDSRVARTEALAHPRDLLDIDAPVVDRQ